MTCPFFFFQQRSAEELLAKCKKLAALFSFTGKVLLTFPRFTSRRIMEKSNLRWAQSNWRIYVSVFYSTPWTKLQYSAPQNLFFFSRLLCRRLSILPEEGEDCLSNSSNENWNFNQSGRNSCKNSFRRTHSEEKDSIHPLQSNSVHNYQKHKFSSKSMDRIAGVVSSDLSASPPARSTSR